MNQVVGKILQEIGARGVISFARFMELALYCPVYGYYETETDTIGRKGDFYTSVSVGPLLGELLGFRFSQWLEEWGVKSGEGMVQLVEAGAHRGELARDVLGWLRERRRDLLERLDYWIVEPSECRRRWQEQTLAEFRGKVHWVSHLAELGGLSSAKGVRGVIFSNELLDAMPVHRLGWDAAGRRWFEWGVKWEGTRFVWSRMSQREVEWPGADFGWADLHKNEALQAVLPEGFTLEVCPAAVAWWQQAARVLEWGKLVTFDYGLRAEDLFVPERKNGTLRAYHRHRLSDDLLALPGQQDLTAHVNFTAIQAAGEAAGLKTLAFQTQGQFLTQIAAQVWSSGAGFGDWTPARTRQFQTLTHPEHLGRAFRVLVQERG